MLPVMAAQCGNGLKGLFPSCSPRSTQLHVLALLCAQRDLGRQHHHTGLLEVSYGSTELRIYGEFLQN